LSIQSVRLGKALPKGLSPQKKDDAIMETLLKKPARYVVSLLKKGEISPLELIDMAEKRISAVDKTVNALPTLCLDRARAHAKKLMVTPMADAPSCYLHGLPIVVKDIIDVEGVRSTRGSLTFKNHIPETSDILVQVLEKNGAVVIGRSNTPEFAAGGNTFNDLFGATLNPWDLSKTCGGSSGGTAVALATGQAWLGTGNDLAGSLRIPASYCSVVGLRPSPGRVPNGPRAFLYDSMMVQGPMGRDVKDTALMLDAMAEHHMGDPMSLPRLATSYTDILKQAVKPKKVAYSPNLGIAPIDPEVGLICRKAADIWADAGVTVEEVNLDLGDVEKVFNDIRAFLYTGNLGRAFMDDNRELIKPEVIWNIEQGLNLRVEDVSTAEKLRSGIYRKFYQLFQTFDLLLCPAVAAQPFDVNIRYLTHLEGQKLETYVSWLILTSALTVTACPALSVPCGFTEQGLPVGLQMLAPPQREDKLLSAALDFEALTGLDTQVPIDPKTS
jgi:amidase